MVIAKPQRKMNLICYNCNLLYPINLLHKFKSLRVKLTSLKLRCHYKHVIAVTFYNMMHLNKCNMKYYFQLFQFLESWLIRMKLAEMIRITWGWNRSSEKGWGFLRVASYSVRHTVMRTTSIMGKVAWIRGIQLWTFPFWSSCDRSALSVLWFLVIR